MPRDLSHAGDRFMKVDSFGELERADCALCGSPDTELLVVQHRFGEDFHVVECAGCGLIRTNPRPTAEWKEHFYDPRFNALPEQHGRDFVYAVEDKRLPPIAACCASCRAG